MTVNQLAGIDNRGALVAAGTTANATPPVLDTAEEPCLVLTINVSAVSGGETVTVAVSGVTPSGYSYPILSSAALAATGTTTLSIGKGFPATANVSANAMLPRQVQVTATIAGTGAITYGIDYELGD